jgi:hypothetical protein
MTLAAIPSLPKVFLLSLAQIRGKAGYASDQILDIVQRPRVAVSFRTASQTIAHNVRSGKSPSTRFGIDVLQE